MEDEYIHPSLKTIEDFGLLMFMLGGRKIRHLPVISRSSDGELNMLWETHGRTVEVAIWGDDTYSLFSENTFTHEVIMKLDLKFNMDRSYITKLAAAVCECMRSGG